jgi:hypothetical protein
MNSAANLNNIDINSARFLTSKNNLNEEKIFDENEEIFVENENENENELN